MSDIGICIDTNGRAIGGWRHHVFGQPTNILVMVRTLLLEVQLEATACRHSI